jgi:hypothetical protein
MGPILWFRETNKGNDVEIIGFPEPTFFVVFPLLLGVHSLPRYRRLSCIPIAFPRLVNVSTLRVKAKSPLMSYIYKPHV